MIRDGEVPPLVGHDRRGTEQVLRRRGEPVRKLVLSLLASAQPIKEGSR